MRNSLLKMRRGRVDLLTLAGILFLLSSIGIGTYVLTSEKYTFNPNKKAFEVSEATTSTTKSITEKSVVQQGSKSSRVNEQGLTAKQSQLQDIITQENTTNTSDQSPNLNNNNQKSTFQCDANGRKYNPGDVVIGGTGSGSSGYATCNSNGRWENCANCSITSLTEVPVYLLPEYNEAVEKEKLKAAAAELEQKKQECEESGRTWLNSTCLDIETHSSLSGDENNQQLTESELALQRFKEQELLENAPTSESALQKFKEQERRDRLIYTSVGPTELSGLSINNDTPRYTSYAQCIKQESRLTNIIDHPGGPGEESYCQSFSTDDEEKFVFRSGANALSLGAFERQVNAFQPDKVTYYWQKEYNSLEECKHDNFGKDMPAYYACSKVNYTPEQNASSIALGTNVTIVGAVGTLLGSGLGVAATLTNLLGIGTVYSYGHAADVCITYPDTPQCREEQLNAAVNTVNVVTAGFAKVPYYIKAIGSGINIGADEHQREVYCGESELSSDSACKLTYIAAAFDIFGVGGETINIYKNSVNSVGSVNIDTRFANDQELNLIRELEGQQGLTSEAANIGKNANNSSDILEPPSQLRAVVEANPSENLNPIRQIVNTPETPTVTRAVETFNNQTKSQSSLADKFFGKPNSISLLVDSTPPVQKPSLTKQISDAIYTTADELSGTLPKSSINTNIPNALSEVGDQLFTDVAKTEAGNRLLDIVTGNPFKRVDNTKVNPTVTERVSDFISDRFQNVSLSNKSTQQSTSNTITEIAETTRSNQGIQNWWRENVSYPNKLRDAATRLEGFQIDTTQTIYKEGAALGHYRPYKTIKEALDNTPDPLGVIDIVKNRKSAEEAIEQIKQILRDRGVIIIENPLDPKYLDIVGDTRNFSGPVSDKGQFLGMFRLSGYKRVVDDELGLEFTFIPNNADIKSYVVLHPELKTLSPDFQLKTLTHEVGHYVEGVVLPGVRENIEGIEGALKPNSEYIPSLYGTHAALSSSDPIAAGLRGQIDLNSNVLGRPANYLDSPAPTFIQNLDTWFKNNIRSADGTWLPKKPAIEEVNFTDNESTDKLIRYIIDDEKITNSQQLAVRIQRDQQNLIQTYGYPPFSKRFSDPEGYVEDLLAIADKEGAKIDVNIDNKVRYDPDTSTIYLKELGSKDRNIKQFVHELSHHLTYKKFGDISIEKKEYYSYILELGDSVAVEKEMKNNFAEFVFGGWGVRGSTEFYYRDLGITDYPWEQSTQPLTLGQSIQKRWKSFFPIYSNPEYIIRNFDPKEELATILTLPSKPRSVRKVALQNFKDNLAFQRRGFIEIQTGIENLIRKNKFASEENILSETNRIMNKYNFNPEQRQNVSEAINDFIENRKKIDSVLSTHKDPADLFEALYLERPKGKVGVEYDGISLQLKLYNKNDFDLAYGTQNAATTVGGFSTTPSYDSSLPQFRLVVVNNVGINRFLLKNSVLTHETQHAIYGLAYPYIDLYKLESSNGGEYFLKMYNTANSSLEQKQLVNNFIYETRYEANEGLKNEVLAMLKQGQDVYPDIAHRLYLEQDVYSFYSRLIRLDDIDLKDLPIEVIESVSTSAYRKMISDSFDSFDELLRSGLTRNEAVALLEVTPIEEWTKLATQLPKPSSRLLGQLNLLAQKISTPTALQMAPLYLEISTLGVMIWAYVNPDSVIEILQKFL